MGEHGHLAIFFVSSEPIFFSHFHFFNLYLRINVAIQLKVTGQFCRFHWGLAPYLALEIIPVLTEGFWLLAHGHFRCSPRVSATNETCRNICHWQKKKNSENTGIHLWWWELCLITFLYQLFYLFRFQLHHDIFPSFLLLYPYQFQAFYRQALVECCIFHSLTHASFVWT